MGLIKIKQNIIQPFVPLYWLRFLLEPLLHLQLLVFLQPVCKTRVKRKKTNRRKQTAAALRSRLRFSSSMIFQKSFSAFSMGSASFNSDSPVPPSVVVFSAFYKIFFSRNSNEVESTNLLRHALICLDYLVLLVLELPKSSHVVFLDQTSN